MGWVSMSWLSNILHEFGDQRCSFCAMVYRSFLTFKYSKLKFSVVLKKQTTWSKTYNIVKMHITWSCVMCLNTTWHISNAISYDMLATMRYVFFCHFAYITSVSYINVCCLPYITCSVAWSKPQWHRWPCCLLYPCLEDPLHMAGTCWHGSPESSSCAYHTLRVDMLLTLHTDLTALHQLKLYLKLMLSGSSMNTAIAYSWKGFDYSFLFEERTKLLLLLHHIINIWLIIL